MEYYVQFWAPQYKKHWHSRVSPGEANKMAWGWYTGHMRKVCKSSVCSAQRGHSLRKILLLTTTWLEDTEKTEAVFLEMYSDRMSGNIHKVEHWKFPPDNREKKLPQGWSNTGKCCLVELKNLHLWGVQDSTSKQEFGLDDLQRPFQPKLFYDLNYLWKINRNCENTCIHNCISPSISYCLFRILRI